MPAKCFPFGVDGGRVRFRFFVRSFSLVTIQSHVEKLTALSALHLTIFGSLDIGLSGALEWRHAGTVLMSVFVCSRYIFIKMTRPRVVWFSLFLACGRWTWWTRLAWVADNTLRGCRMARGSCDALP